MSATVLDMSMSLDGSIAGPNEGPGNGLGDGGHRLHEWALTGAHTGEMEVVPTGVNREVFDEMMSTGPSVRGPRCGADRAGTDPDPPGRGRCHPHALPPPAVRSPAGPANCFSVALRSAPRRSRCAPGCVGQRCEPLLHQRPLGRGERRAFDGELALERCGRSCDRRCACVTCPALAGRPVGGNRDRGDHRLAELGCEGRIAEQVWL